MVATQVTSAIGTQTTITHLAQEATELAYRLGFGKKVRQKMVKKLAEEDPKMLHLLNGGALFCWECDNT